MDALSSGVTRGLSEGGNSVERDPLATVGGTANIQKKMRNDGESRCGWLY